jgi:hypothetical protein
MTVEDGVWIMRGLARNDPGRLRSARELATLVNKIGFLPLFSGEIKGFSVEEKTSASSWWTGNRAEDPWEWREIIAAGHEVAYGKFFGGRAGFISKKWLPFFANFRRNGYDFDARWEDGLANRREKLIMDRLTGRDSDGDMTFPDIKILSTDLKKQAGFGKGGEKNYAGIMTSLQMQTYLVITDFCRRKNKRGEEYGMSVSILQPPETIFGYEAVTSAYNEKPAESRARIAAHIRKLFPGASDGDIDRLIGK